MRTRLGLHAKLVSILGSNNCYFQPPENLKLQYPCIIYERNTINQVRADNQLYKHNVEYRLTLIGNDPDNVIITSLLELPYCTYDRHFVADSLNHDVFTLYL